MKKILNATICIFALTTIGITSCKKSSSSTPNYLVGTWKITSEAFDINGNGKIDAGEASSVATDTPFSTNTYKFNADGTAVFTYTSGTHNATWAYENNNSYLKIVEDGMTAYNKIDNLGSSAMSLRDTASGAVVWVIFSKQ